MTQRRRILGILALGLLALFVMVVIRSKEPSYEGRSLSRCLVILSGKGGYPLEERYLAEEAIRQFGTNALPYLLTAIKWEQPA
jgi:hypothetical protein